MEEAALFVVALFAKILPPAAGAWLLLLCCALNALLAGGFWLALGLVKKPVLNMSDGAAVARLGAVEVVGQVVGVCGLVWHGHKSRHLVSTIHPCQVGGSHSPHLDLGVN